MQGILILFAHAAIILLLTVMLTKKENDVERFCVSDRNVGWFVSALSIAATWIWAPALFVSTERAYINGWVGLFWFLVPNILCLILFIPFAKRIRREMPAGITLSGYMKDKYKSDGVKRVYLFQLTGLSILSTSVQLLAGSKVLSLVTGLPFWLLTVLLAMIGYSYSQFSGIKASMLTNAIQAVFMLVVAVSFVFFGIQTCGAGSLSHGLAGFSGEYTALFSGKGMEVFLGFGLPAAIALISGPFGDQSFWQRAFAIKERNISRSFFAGALIFGIIPLSMGILGLLGAGIGYQAHDTGVINLEMISLLFPTWVMIPFLFMIVCGLLSTVDSNLCAVSSLTTDIKKDLKKSKISMVMLLIAGIAIANIPSLTVTHLFLFYGTLRASTLLPTVFTLKGIQLSSKGVAIGIVNALLVGLPIFACGTILNNPLYKTIGSLVTVLLSGLVAIIISKVEAKYEKYSW